VLDGVVVDIADGGQIGLDGVAQKNRGGHGKTPLAGVAAAYAGCWPK
jgi:hypothetical protein